MKRIMIAIVGLILAGSAWAKDPCRQREYSELKDLSKSEMLEDYKAISDESVRAGSAAATELDIDTKIAFAKRVTFCNERREEFDRQFIKRFHYSEAQRMELYKKYPYGIIGTTSR